MKSGGLPTRFTPRVLLRAAGASARDGSRRRRHTEGTPRVGFEAVAAAARAMGYT